MSCYLEAGILLTSPPSSSSSNDAYQSTLYLYCLIILLDGMSLFASFTYIVQFVCPTRTFFFLKKRHQQRHQLYNAVFLPEIPSCLVPLGLRGRGDHLHTGFRSGCEQRLRDLFLSQTSDQELSTCSDRQASARTSTPKACPSVVWILQAEASKTRFVISDTPPCCGPSRNRWTRQPDTT